MCVYIMERDQDRLIEKTKLQNSIYCMSSFVVLKDVYIYLSFKKKSFGRRTMELSQ